jgi:hypothetical protein
MAKDVEAESKVPPGGRAARLCNLPTGVMNPVLLPDHKTWLTTNVVNLLKTDPSAAVELIGMASHLGTVVKKSRFQIAGPARLING